MSEDIGKKPADVSGSQIEPCESTHEKDQSATLDSDRYGFDEVSGLPVVNARPGARLVTSEEILEQLEDFP